MLHTRGVANSAAKRGLDGPKRGAAYAEAALAHASSASASAPAAGSVELVGIDAASAAAAAAEEGDTPPPAGAAENGAAPPPPPPRDTVLNDPARYSSSPALRRVVQLGNWCHRVSSHDAFANLIFGAIGFAAVLVATQTYPGMDVDPVVVGLDTFVLYIFVLELVLKVLANPLRPHLYWVGPEWRWNNFDFAIVAMCVLPLDLPGGGGVVALRMFRLLRVVKIIKKIPQLQVCPLATLALFRSSTSSRLTPLLVCGCCCCCCCCCRSS